MEYLELHERKKFRFEKIVLASELVSIFLQDWCLQAENFILFQSQELSALIALIASDSQLIL